MMTKIHLWILQHNGLNPAKLAMNWHGWHHTDMKSNRDNAWRWKQFAPLCGRTEFCSGWGTMKALGQVCVTVTQRTHRKPEEQQRVEHITAASERINTLHYWAVPCCSKETEAENSSSSAKKRLLTVYERQCDLLLQINKDFFIKNNTWCPCTEYNILKLQKTHQKHSNDSTEVFLLLKVIVHTKIENSVMNYSHF